MNRRVNLLNRWLCGVMTLVAVVNAVLSDTAMERVAWLAAAGAGAVGFCLAMAIFHLQNIVRLERKQSEFWKDQARRSGAEAYRLARRSS